MPKPPVFVDPPDLDDEDILAALTAPVRKPSAQQPTQPASPDSAATSSRAEGAGVAKAGANQPPTTALEAGAPASAERGAAGEKARNVGHPQRRAPNVSLYLSPAQKRELMRLKADLDLDYTEIILDALRARHPTRGWGS
jgi:hypothetical protein